MYRRTIVCGFILTALGCGESGPPLVEATGSVVYRGNPLESASVTFQPEQGQPAVGRTDAQGKFRLATRGRPGVSPGRAKVAITAAEAIGDVPSQSEVEVEIRTRSLIPEKYGSFETSGLAVAVDGSRDNDFTFDLTD